MTLQRIKTITQVTLNKLSAGYRSSNALNDDFDLIEEGFSRTLSRTETEGNQMEAALDMNSNRIINLAAPVDDNDPARLQDLKDVTIDILATDIEAIAEVAGAEAAEAAVGPLLDTKVDKGFEQIPNPLAIDGPFQFRSLGTEEVPPDGVYVGPGNSASFNTFVSEPESTTSNGDDQRASLLVVARTGDDGNSEEQTLCILTDIKTGYSRPWVVSTAYALGDNITQAASNAVYRCIVAGTSAATGTGPAGKAPAIVDGTVTWMWINDAAINAKVGIYNEVIGSPGGGSSWAQANNFDMKAGFEADFAVNTEFDLTNHTGYDSGFGFKNKYNVWLAAQGPNRSTSNLEISSANTETDACIWGLHFAGPRLASNSVIGIDASSAIGIGAGVGAGGAVTPTFTTAFIRDRSTSPTGASFAGTYSSAQITLPQGGGAPAAIAISGTKTLATILDLSTAPIGIDLQGTYSVAAIQVTGTSPAAYTSSGTKTIAGWVDSSTAPFGINLEGTYSAAQIAGNNFQVLPDGSMVTQSLRFNTVPADCVDDAAAAAVGILVGGVYRTGSVLKVRVT